MARLEWSKHQLQNCYISRLLFYTFQNKSIPSLLKITIHGHVSFFNFFFFCRLSHSLISYHFSAPSEISLIFWSNRKSFQMFRMSTIEIMIFHQIIVKRQKFLLNLREPMLMFLKISRKNIYWWIYLCFLRLGTDMRWNARQRNTSLSRKWSKNFLHQTKFQLSIMKGCER